jgi:hypothetical protein
MYMGRTNSNLILAGLSHPFPKEMPKRIIGSIAQTNSETTFQITFP